MRHFNNVQLMDLACVAKSSNIDTDPMPDTTRRFQFRHIVIVGGAIQV